jgi:5S rRNA maturation endonuclease (ribonuclease M5)
MAIIRVRNHNVDVDIEREVNEFSWSRAKWRPERLIACSPFRYDSSPSFYVYFNDTNSAKAGSWGDSGGEGEFKKGYFVQLLAFLRNETEHETEDYLLTEYAREYTEEDELRLDFSHLRLKEEPNKLPRDYMSRFEGYNSYLKGRGVKDVIYRLMGVGYDSKSKAVVIPWHFPDGRLANIKYRRTDSKVFYYDKGHPIRELVYGLNIIHDRNVKRAVLTEAEIDAMYVMSHGKIAAIAAGTSKISDEKAEAIARSPLEEIIIIPDNDTAGRVMLEQAIEKLSRYVRIKVARLPNWAKDANDVRDTDELRKIIENAKEATISLF